MTVLQFPDRAKDEMGDKVDKINILSNACYLYMVNKLMEVGFDALNDEHKERMTKTFVSIQSTFASFYGIDMGNPPPSWRDDPTYRY